MKRLVAIVSAAGLLAAAGYGLVVGVWWVVARLVAGTYPYLVQARMHTAMGVLLVLLLWITFLGAALAGILAPHRSPLPRSRRPALQRRHH